MKRRVFWFIFIIILLCATLSRNALRPDRFTGTWYVAGNGEAYHFREGIIRSSRDTFEGAYAFTQDTITLFVRDPDGNSAVRTLRWIRDRDGDQLCTNAQEVCFCRNQETAYSLK